VSDEVLKALQGLTGVRNVQPFTNGTQRIVVESDAREELMTQIARVVVDKEAGLIRMSPVQLALEEYYLDLIGGRRSTT
jgi:hypothetical protein